MRPSSCLSVVAVAGVLFAAAPAFGQASPPAPHADAAFDVMNYLAHHGQHDIDDETWNAYGQMTLIGSNKFPFSSPLGWNVGGSDKSLLPGAEQSFTASFTLFLGLRLWKGGEVYLVPEVIAERPLSGLAGLGGAIQNFELQKTGSETPQLYRSRTYFRQTFGFGGERVVKESNPMQLGTTVDGRRLVLTAGNFTILDVFDRNGVVGDPRRNFFNMAFMTYAAWDFPSDARGYSWGGTAELYWDDWAVRVGLITPPQSPNALEIDFRLYEFYGAEAEIEHDHRLFGQPGAVRLVAFQNRVNSGSFSDAIAAFRADPSKNADNCGSLSAYNSTNANAPDLCWVRRPNTKVGIGASLEQSIADDVGVFARGMVTDGRTEVYAYTSTDRSFAAGAVAQGTRWHRPSDTVGAGYGLGWISQSHAQYLEMGGVDGFVGDGYLRPGAEGVVEAFYSAGVLSWLWLSADYQHIWNPAFNAARGPVDIVAARVHAEF